LENPKIEGGRTAIRQLNDAQELIRSAYQQLISDGVKVQQAKTICRLFFKSAIADILESSQPE
jgi:predicted transcriptional regulator